MLWGMFVGRICWAVVLFSNDERTFEWTSTFRESNGNSPLHGRRIKLCLDIRDGIFGRNHKDKKKFWELLSTNSESQANMADGLEPLSRKHIRSDTSSLHANSLTSGGIIFFNCNCLTSIEWTELVLKMLEQCPRENSGDYWRTQYNFQYLCMLVFAVTITHKGKIEISMILL